MGDFVCPICGKSPPPTRGLVDPMDLLMTHLQQHTGDELRSLVAAVRELVSEDAPFRMTKELLKMDGGDIGYMLAIVDRMKDTIKNLDALTEAVNTVALTEQEPRGEG